MSASLASRVRSFPDVDSVEYDRMLERLDDGVFSLGVDPHGAAVTWDGDIEGPLLAHGIQPKNSGYEFVVNSVIYQALMYDELYELTVVDVGGDRYNWLQEFDNASVIAVGMDAVELAAEAADKAATDRKRHVIVINEYLELFGHADGSAVIEKARNDGVHMVFADRYPTEDFEDQITCDGELDACMVYVDDGKTSLKPGRGFAGGSAFSPAVDRVAINVPQFPTRSAVGEAPGLVDRVLVDRALEG